MPRRVLFLLVFLLQCDSVFAASQLPLPRFASLRSSPVNIRVGPGPEYPVEWVMVRAPLPVEIISEFDTWRKIRDSEGAEGWVHQNMLAGGRLVINTKNLQRLHKKPDIHSEPLVMLEAGVLGKILECKDEWCRIKVDGAKGWIPKHAVWGVYETEQLK